ncbi:UNVERIFIED_CONTAM: hypothetical protein FKN15_071383 [Acipenser sinensis]
MASVVCRVQFLDDMDPFVCTNLPEPRRPPPYTLYEDISLIEQVAGVHKLLESPLKLEDCALQLSPSGNYLDLDLTLSEQKDDLEQFYEDIGSKVRIVAWAGLDPSPCCGEVESWRSVWMALSRLPNSSVHILLHYRRLGLGVP